MAAISEWYFHVSSGETEHAKRAQRRSIENGNLPMPENLLMTLA